MRSLFFTLSMLFLFSCQEEKQTSPEEQLGTVHFNVTGKTEAKPLFTKGLLLLHSFEFDDAAEAFREARQLDPDFAMAYWGEAMTCNKPLWRMQDREQADSIMQLWAPTKAERLAKVPEGLERDFWEGMEILYAPEGEKNERDVAYNRHLEKLYAKHPGNQEVAAFYALSMLGAVPVGRDEEAYEKGARIAQGVLAENPSHPGALHYLIHSYDDPAHAKFALDAANAYAKVAPDAEHALHMPSHIYVAMGMWDEVISSNVASYEASVKRVKKLDLDDNERGWHAWHWLQYGYLQRGEFEKAKQIAEEAYTLMDSTAQKRARAYMISMKASYLAETDDWDSPIANYLVDHDDLSIVSRTKLNFMEGYKAWRKKDAKALLQVIEDVEKKRTVAATYVTGAGAPMCSANTSFKPNQLDLDQAMIMEMELRALAAQLANKPKLAEEWFQKAADLDASISYSYGPPTVAWPIYELYGNWLLENNRPEEALAQFEKALQRGPARARALKGKQQAQKMKKIS